MCASHMRDHQQFLMSLISLKNSETTFDYMLLRPTFLIYTQHSQPYEEYIKTVQSPGCVCGADHRWARCFYLIESIRPADWKEDEGIRKKIDERLASNPKLKKAVEEKISWMKWKAEKENTKADGTSTTTQATNPKKKLTRFDVLFGNSFITFYSVIHSAVPGGVC
jgi:hypothetical protein